MPYAPSCAPAQVWDQRLRWNTTFPELTGELKLVCHDWEKGRKKLDDFVGQAAVPLADLPWTSQPVHEMSIPLSTQGVIRFTVSFRVPHASGPPLPPAHELSISPWDTTSRSHDLSISDTAPTTGTAATTAAASTMAAAPAAAPAMTPAAALVAVSGAAPVAASAAALVASSSSAGGSSPKLRGGGAKLKKPSKELRREALDAAGERAGKGAPLSSGKGQPRWDSSPPSRRDTACASPLPALSPGTGAPSGSPPGRRATACAAPCASSELTKAAKAAKEGKEGKGAKGGKGAQEGRGGTVVSGGPSGKRKKPTRRKDTGELGGVSKPGAEREVAAAAGGDPLSETARLGDAERPVEMVPICVALTAVQAAAWAKLRSTGLAPAKAGAPAKDGAPAAVEGVVERPLLRRREAAAVEDAQQRPVLLYTNPLTGREGTLSELVSAAAMPAVPADPWDMSIGGLFSKPMVHQAAADPHRHANCHPPADLASVVHAPAAAPAATAAVVTPASACEAQPTEARPPREAYPLPRCDRLPAPRSAPPTTRHSAPPRSVPPPRRPTSPRR